MPRVSSSDTRFILRARVPLGVAALTLMHLDAIGSEHNLLMQLPAEADRGGAVAFPLRTAYRLDPPGVSPAPSPLAMDNSEKSQRARTTYLNYRTLAHELVFETVPTLPMPATIRSAELMVFQCARPDRLRAYNWRTARWELIAPRAAPSVKDQALALPLPTDFLLNPPGLLRVKLEVAKGKRGSDSFWLQVHP